MSGTPRSSTPAAWSRRAVGLGALTLLAGCLAPTTPTRFYVLDSQPGPAPTGPDTSKLAIGIAPIDLPDYLDRPEMVIRQGDNRLILGDFDKWGERLDQLLGRTLAEDLATRLGTPNIFQMPLQRDQTLDYVIVLDIYRFEGTDKDVAVLDTRWRIFDRDGARLRVTSRKLFEVKLSDAGFRALATALSTAVADLSDALTDSIRSLVKR
jgi:uncharacterized lipoprotein YmbA